MRPKGLDFRWMVLAAAIGAVGGGLAVAFAARAIPQMMSRMTSGMMQDMMACMGDEGLNPEER